MHVKIINACAIFYSLIRVEAPNDPLLNEVDHRKEELVDHLFFKCSKTWAVRRKIMLWLGIARRSTTIRSVIKWAGRQIQGSQIVQMAKRITLMATVVIIWRTQTRLSLMEKLETKLGSSLRSKKLPTASCTHIFTWAGYSPPSRQMMEFTSFGCFGIRRTLSHSLGYSFSPWGVSSHGIFPPKGF